MDVEVDGVPLEQHPSLLVTQPLSVLGPSGERRYSISDTVGKPRPSHVVITWKDQAGGNRWESGQAVELRSPTAR